MSDIGVADFNRMGEAIKLGEQASYAVLSKLTYLELSSADYAYYRQAARKPPASPTHVDFVEVEGNRKVSEELIRARFGIKPAHAWDENTINDGLRQHLRSGVFPAGGC